MSILRREQLDIIFRLEGESIPDGEIGPIKFSQFVQAGGITAANALRLIISIMRQFQIPMEFKENGEGKSIAVESHLKRVEKNDRWIIPVEAGGLSFQFGSVPSFKHSFVIIKEINAGSAVSWESWIKPFLSEESFSQAWVSDVEYDHWQNAKDPLQYEAVGRSYAHLPKKSNGLPPPLEKMEIDTSNNPGRWSLQSGYIDAIGATMWLGMLFWESVGKHHKEALLSEAELTTRSVGRDIIQVVASEQCFFDESTKEKQNRLRGVLYGKS